MTQNEQIKKYLEEGHTLTSIEAIQKFHCARLAARIKDLRREGIPIETITERRNGKSWARYRIVGQLELL